MLKAQHPLTVLAAVLAGLMLLGSAAPAFAQADESYSSTTRREERQVTTTEVNVEDEEEDPGVRIDLMDLVLWVPNRLFDVMDVVRARVRLGPGFAAGVRATSAVEASISNYDTAWIGLPGPRRDRVAPPLGGVEERAEAVLLGGEAEMDPEEEYENSPRYSPTEIGVTLHLLLVGVDVEVDPVEVIDFVTSIIGIDIRKDDLHSDNYMDDDDDDVNVTIED